MATITDQLATVTANLASIRTGIANLDSQIVAWQNSPGTLSASDQAMLDAIVASSAKVAIAANAVVPTGGGTPPVDDAAILAEVTDSSLAGIEKRLGPAAPAGMVLPDVWARPIVPTVGLARSNYSEGLGTQTAAQFDYGSTEANIIAVADDPLVITVSGANNGVGVYRPRIEESADGVVSEFPAVPWNGQTFPDPHTAGHVANYGMGDKLGRPIAIARGKINRYDVGFVLYDESRGGVAYIGTVGTQTAFAPWSGEQLPAGKIPLSLCLTSQNEFLLVGVHDRATGKGQIGVLCNWAGGDLQQKATGSAFPPDWATAHPGLMNTGVVTGMKILGWVDLPIKWPTNIDCVCSPGVNDRIEGPDGNASYLNIWDLSTQANRDAFVAKNGSWIATWAKACVTSKYESKAVMVDLTALVQGFKDQYFTTQALNDATAYVNPTRSWYEVYGDPVTGRVDDAAPSLWPYGFAFKPEWTPMVGAVIDVPTPTSLLMSERGEAEVAVGCADGMVRFFNFDGTPNGSLQLGPNITSLYHDKYKGAIRAGGFVAVSRVDRAVYRVSNFGPTGAVTLTLQDNRMLDPVAAGMGDTHGIEMPYIWVCDFTGKKVLEYRLGRLEFYGNQGSAVFGTGPTAVADQVAYAAAVAAGTTPLPPIHEEPEFGGSMDLPGKPFAGSDSNVN